MDKIQIPKLKGKGNWSIWKLQIESNLQYHDFEGVLTGVLKEPNALPADANNQQQKDYEAGLIRYKKANGFAITLLTTTVESEPLQLILMLKTAREMWDKLALAYEQKSEQRLEHLYLQLLEYKKDSNDSVAMHISKLQKLWLELNEESMRIDNVELPITLLIMRILSTLPEEYFDFRTTWESVSRRERTLEYLLERLTMIELRVSQRQETGRQSGLSALVAEGQVRHFKSGNDKRYGNRQAKHYNAKKKDYSKVQCYACKEYGHTKYKCTKRPVDNKLSEHVDTKKKEIALFGEALMSDAADYDIWVADSGATHHMTRSHEYFSSYNVFSEPKPVITGNQKIMLAYGSGDIIIEAQIAGVWSRHYLKDVWYTPEVVKNLFSIPSAADKGFNYWLDNKCCKITHEGETFIVGERHLGLYKLLIRTVKPEVPAQVCAVSKIETLQVWHERLGHQNKQYVEKYLTKHNINYLKDNQFCEGCALGKQHRLSFGTRVNSVQKAGDLIHADTCGPMEEESFSGYRYFVCFKDDYSKYRHVYFLKKKSEVSEKLKQFISEAKIHGHVIKELLTDGGGEFDNKDVKELAALHGWNHRMSMPYTPEQNGSSERENRILVEAVRSMLHSKNLPKKLWAEAINTAAYVLNRTGPTKNDVSPYESWFGKIPSIDHFKIFGTECYMHIPAQKRKKFDAKSIKGYIVGYCGDKDGFRIYVPDRDTVMFSRDVTFKDEKTSSFFDSQDIDQDTMPIEKQEHDTELLFSEQVENNLDRANPNEDMDMRTLRDRRQLRQPTRYNDYVLFVSEPQSYSAAMTSDNSLEWKNAMDDEMKSLIENKTWELVNIPADTNLVDNKWVYKVKLHTNGTVDKFKARLVAKGFSQKEGIDYTETFSPVAKFDSIRAILSVAAADKLSLIHFDIKTAFLYGDLDHVIYMKQPMGYEDGSNRVCKLRKSLYGLKQSSRCWNKRFKDFLAKYGMLCSDADPCLFYSQGEGRKLLIALYVDDGLVAYQETNEMLQFLSELETEFRVTYAPATCFLCLEIEQQNDGSIFINQAQYVRRLLDKFNMIDCNTVSTPIDKFHVAQDDTDKLIDDNVPFREAVGSLLYLATGTRSDISFAVSVVSQALSNPTKRHWEMIKRILRYLKGTADIGILYKHGHDKNLLTTYSDADYAGDTLTRRSTSGVLCLYMGGPISWLSQKQRSVALSTTEAEYMAASEATKEIIWLVRLFKEITTMTAIPLLRIDNLSAVKLVHNPVYHKRSKHIDVRYHFVREKCEEGQLLVEHVCGQEQLADILTKPLAKDRFEKLRYCILSN